MTTISIISRTQRPRVSADGISKQHARMTNLVHVVALVATAKAPYYFQMRRLMKTPKQDSEHGQ